MESRRNSEAWRAGRERANAKLKGRRPPLTTIARSLATRSLRAMGLERDSAPTVFEAYFSMYLSELMEKHSEAAA